MSKLRPKKSMTKKKLSDRQYEELGKIVASIYETGYLDRAQSYRMSFLKGMFQGLGGVLGATVLVAILIWTLSLFSEIPLIGNVIENFQNSIEQQQ